MRLNLRHERSPCLLFGNISRYCGNLPERSKLFEGLGTLIFATRGDHHLNAVLQKAFGHVQPETATASGYKRRLTLKTEQTV